MNCPLCTTPVRVIGKVTKHYEPIVNKLSVGQINHALWKVDEKMPLKYRLRCAKAIVKLEGEI